MGNILSPNTVFEKCLGLLDLQNFRCPYSDTYAKKLLTGTTILLLIDAQLRGLASLPDVEIGLRANDKLQTFVGLDSIHASSLYRKMEQLPLDTLQRLCFQVLGQLNHLHRDKKGIPNLGRLNVIDSSEISLPKKAGEWAYCSRDKNGVKLHLRLVVADRDTTFPNGAALSTSAVSDQEGALHLVVEDDAIYVFDRGYLNYHLYNQWSKQNISFVARVKANSKLRIVQELPVPVGSNVLKDAIVEITDPKTEETFQLRLVEYTDEKQHTYRVVTTLREHTAEEIAEIYKSRWFIELFFKWIKSHLKIKQLFNHKPEAVWSQIYIALIAYGLSELVQQEAQTKQSTWTVLRTMRHYWFLKWEAFVQELNREPTRSSKGRKKKGKPGRPRKYPKKLTAQQILITSN